MSFAKRQGELELTVLQKAAQAGTLESNDIMITVSPADPGDGIRIELSSPLIKQFGRQIKLVISETIQEYGLSDALVHANDRGALDCTIRARVRAAVERAARGEEQ